MSEYNQGEFLAALNGEFQLAADAGGPLSLVLKKVSEIKKSGPVESFSIEFCGPKTKLLEQGTYELTHKSMGTKCIFLVPVGEGSDQYEYQAVFSSKPQELE